MGDRHRFISSPDRLLRIALRRQEKERQTEEYKLVSADVVKVGPLVNSVVL